jgi:hypothetical protein
MPELGTKLVPVEIAINSNRLFAVAAILAQCNKGSALQASSPKTANARPATGGLFFS